MVDISDKVLSARVAIAEGKIFMDKKTIKSIEDKSLPKGDVLTVAKISGIQAAKKTSELIPLSHSLVITSVNIDFYIKNDRLECISEVSSDGKTGVEIEALCSAQIALLTIYDMCKYIDKSMIISEIKLVSKKGGKSGTYRIKR